MLFYGKEIDFTTIILMVIFILAIYILFSYYQQQKDSIPIVVTSNPATTVNTVAIPEKIQLNNGAFALSIWMKLNSAIQLSPQPSSSFNLLQITKKGGTSPSPIRLSLDSNRNLIVSTISSTKTTDSTIMLFPIGESVNVVLNYNGDDDIDPNETNETVYDPTTNKNIPVYNPDSNTFYNGSKRALDVYINGLLNNTISVDTLTNSKADADSPPYITYMDASMNYITTNGNQVLVGDNQPTIAMDGTISNAAFIQHGCSPREVLTIFNQGDSGSILENLLSYKLRFSFIENNKEMNTYDFP